MVGNDRDSDFKSSSSRAHPTLQVWAVDISGFSASSPSSGGHGLDESITSLLEQAGSSGSGIEEAKKVKKFLREVDRIRALVSKLLPRLMFLTYHPECSWSNMKFETTKEGRPFLESPKLKSPVDFNLTHDSSWVILAFHLPTSRSPSASPDAASTSSSEMYSHQKSLALSLLQEDCEDQPLVQVGIDVMRISLPHYEETSQSFAETMDLNFTKEELKWVLEPYGQEDSVNSSSSEPESEGKVKIIEGKAWKSLETLSRLYDLWTHKEAFTKNVGKGLGFDFTLIQLHFWRCREIDPLNSTTSSSDKNSNSTPKIQEENLLKLTELKISDQEYDFPMGDYQFQELSESERFALERGARASEIPSSHTSKGNTDTTILRIKGIPDPSYKFTEITLPDGQVRDVSQRKIVSSEEGGRDWVASQCVIAEGPFLNGKEGSETRSEIQRCISAKEAVKMGLLKIWKMEEIVERAWEAREEREVAL